MSNKVYFTPGPSQLYPSVGPYIQQALSDDVASISHRSAKFKAIYAETCEALRSLIGLPENYEITFVGSATEIWERILKNCVAESSHHLVNGSFSKRFFEYAEANALKATKTEVDFGKGFDVNNIDIPENNELICVTHNETSSGVMFPVEDIYKLREKHPNALIAADVVSSLPQPDIDYTKIDTALFSVQKCFGLPAGLGVWLVNDRCIERSKELQAKGHIIGPHHDLPDLSKRAQGYQTPSTPNVLGIYLLGKVCQDMLKKGIDTIREETSQKADMLYSFVEESDILSPFVQERAHRSETVIVADTKRAPEEINKSLSGHNIAVGTGYGSYKSSQLRIANFPAHSVEKTEELIELLKLQEAYA